jgi:cell division septation protein DedD
MSVASSETEVFKDKIEVSLDGRQIFYLFFGGAVIATLVFVLGVMVGRQVESRTVAESGSPATDPLAALDRLEAGSELAFPAALRGDEVILGSVDAKVDGRAKLAKENLATGGPSPAAAVADKPTPAEKKPEVLSKQKPEAAKKPEAKPAKAVVAPSAETEEVAEAEPAPAEPKAKRRRFTLQVGSFQDKAEADTFFRGLSGGPYDPYMVEADVPGKGKYFRVRVGGYGTFDEAVAAKSEFEASQHVIAYVTRLK